MRSEGSTFESLTFSLVLQVYAVGIGNVYLDELRFIASDPDIDHVFVLNSFNDAPDFVDFLSFTACDSKCTDWNFPVHNAQWLVLSMLSLHCLSSIPTIIHMIVFPSCTTIIKYIMAYGDKDQRVYKTSANVM